jgi:hypothetical protein
MRETTLLRVLDVYGLWIEIPILLSTAPKLVWLLLGDPRFPVWRRLLPLLSASGRLSRCSRLTIVDDSDGHAALLVVDTGRHGFLLHFRHPHMIVGVVLVGVFLNLFIWVSPRIRCRMRLGPLLWSL